MKNKPIPTAEELLDSIQRTYDGAEGQTIHATKNEILEIMIEFAKLHVESAIKQASKKVSKKIYDLSWSKDIQTITKNSILSSYPLSNIK